MTVFTRFLDSHGIMYNILRNGIKINTLKGLPNEDNGKEYIGFMPDSDILEGDCLVNPAGERVIVIRKNTDYAYGKPLQISAYIIPESEYYKNQKQQDNQSIFNIGEVHNSIVGTQQNATVNNGYSIDDLNQLIEQNNSIDKELLKEMVSLLENAISDRKPIHKGFLSKFAGVLQRNEWITAPIATFILEKFLV